MSVQLAPEAEANILARLGKRRADGRVPTIGYTISFGTEIEVEITREQAEQLYQQLGEHLL